MAACSPAYKKFPTVAGDPNTINKFRPAFTVALYKTEINVTGHYLSGLLLIKEMPDSSTRLLFSNELGFKFFDFEFSKDGGFKMYYIIKQMNKKAVIKTLRKDFELVLMQNLHAADASIKNYKPFLYYIFPQQKGYNSYITDSTGNTLIRMERSSKRKTVVSVITKNDINGIPDSIGITHHNFEFTIGLKRIER